MRHWLNVLTRKVKSSSENASETQGQCSIAFSCVADSDTRFIYQAARLLLSLRWFGGNVSDAPFYLCTIAKLSDECAKFFERHGGFVRYCEAFDTDQPHITSNKLRGLEIDDLEKFDHIVLIDCDTLIVRDPSRYCVGNGVGIKLADVPTVKDDKLKKILTELGISAPDRRFEYELANAHTFGYFNSGVVVLARKWLRPFAETWVRRCRQLLELEKSLEIPAHFVEQSALTATVAELDIPLSVLLSSMNLPVHFKANRYPDSYQDIDPEIIHYHWLSNEDGFIKQLPLKMANLRANAFNTRLRAEMKSRESAIKPQSPASAMVADSAKTKPKVIVSSGWWCDQKPHDWALGADITRKTSFFYLWLRQVEQYLNPDRIVITDSNSPLKPDWQSHPKVHWIELDKNYGGPNDVREGKVDTKFSGFTKGVINGAMYALCCDADYYIYVEQDCLIRGDSFLEHAIGDSEAEIFLGQRTQGGKGIEGKSAAPMIQQSCIIVKSSGLERFISKTMEGPETDGELSPEVKMDRDLKPYDFVQLPFGRSRPLDFGLSHFYAQHLDEDELNAFLEAEGLDRNLLLPLEARIIDL